MSPPPRLLGYSTNPQIAPSRCRVLPAYVDIMLAAHQVSAAQTAADELFTIAETLGAPFLRAAAAHARGAVLLAQR